MNYKQELPKDVEKKLNIYIKRIKNIQWFKPGDNLSKKAIDKQIKFFLEAFGVKAGIEYRWLKTPNDWNTARDAAWDAARGAARGAAWDAARGATCGATWECGAAWDAARGADDILVEDLEEYKKKYPQGNFKNLIPLWEMGLYPIGVIDGKFVVYIPPCRLEFPKLK